MNRLSAFHASGSGRRCSLRHLAAIAVITALAATACGGGHVDRGRAGFGSGGKVRTDFGAVAGANALAIQRDGRFVAAGLAGRDFALARYTHDGRLDQSFGKGGKVVTDFGAPSAGGHARGAVAVAIQADGTIVAAGGSGTDFALTRYTPTGRLDRSFGTGGKVLTDVGARVRAADDGASWKNGASAVALQDDGRIVAAGAGDGVFALARYLPDGRLDASFGTGGKVVTNFGGKVTGGGAYADAAVANAVAVQADGKIIAAGRSANDLALTRYLPDGRLDASFGTGGKFVAKLGFDDFDEAKAVALQADGKIVAAGSSWPRNGYWLVVRLTARGRLDRSFGSDGIAGSSNGGAGAVAMQRDGKMVALGDVFVPETEIWSSALIRFTRSGHPDQAFGNGGSVRIGLAGHRQGTAVVIQHDGKIVVAGNASSRSGSSDFLLVRYKPNGDLDR
jgi:uncharacterized delta-60 repeat protein